MSTTLVHVGVRVTDIDKTMLFSDGLRGKIPEGGRIEEGAFKVEDPDGISVDVTASDDQWPGTALK